MDLIKFSIPGKPEYVGVVRLAVSSLANKSGFDIEAIEDIKIAVSEACTNALIHGGQKCLCNYDVECEVEEAKLTITVIDCGKGYAKKEYKEPDCEEPKESGLGIYIIKTLMDEVEIVTNENKGTSIKMCKYK